MRMKKLLCLALSGMLLAGSVPAYGAEWEIREIPHTFTAKVGTTEFCKDGEAQPLDVPIYIKDGYVMLPMRAFLMAAFDYAKVVWGEEKMPAALIGEYIVAMDVKENKIHVNGSELSVFGKIEIRDGRLFVPLRNWGNILNACGYTVGSEDIQWDAVEKIAVITATETKLEVERNAETPVITGEGQAPTYALVPTQEYDWIENLGDGYFLAEKFVEGNVGLGVWNGDSDNIRYLLDAKGTVLHTYDTGTDNYMRNGKEGTFLVGRRTEDGFGNGVIDREGNTVVPFLYNKVEPFSEGLALVSGGLGVGYGFVDRTGEMVIPLQYTKAESFSEGLAAVEVLDQWGFIDKTGKLVIDAKYRTASDFHEGLARVRSSEGVGYIDKEGKEVIPCQYRWGGYFRNGVTYVIEEENWKTWLIDKTGKKLKLITEGEYVGYQDDSFANDGKLKNGVLQREEIVDYANTHAHIISLYDETGEISFETYELKKGLSEGLSPIMDEETGKRGYVDENGVQIIAPTFDKAEPFRDGYAVVANEVTLENGMVDAEWGILRHPEA